ncbi:hypothetical protein D3C81_1394410 [compost metagenome]
MINPAEITDSDTCSGANLRMTHGTTFQLKTMTTAKNMNFFKMTTPRLTSPPAKLMTKANRMMTRTSSMTAAPRIVVPSLDFSRPISFNACTEMLTLVAESSSPRKIASKRGMPNSMAAK